MIVIVAGVEMAAERNAGEVGVALAAETAFAPEANDATTASRKDTLAVIVLTLLVQKVVTTAVGRVTLAVTVLSRERSARRIASTATSPATLPPSVLHEVATITISQVS